MITVPSYLQYIIYCICLASSAWSVFNQKISQVCLTNRDSPRWRILCLYGKKTKWRRHSNTSAATWLQVWYGLTNRDGPLWRVYLSLWKEQKWRRHSNTSTWFQVWYGLWCVLWSEKKRIIPHTQATQRIKCKHTSLRIYQTYSNHSTGWDDFKQARNTKYSVGWEDFKKARKYQVLSREG